MEGEAKEFRRLVRVYYFPLALIGAVGVAFAFPPAPNLVLATLVIAAGFVVYVIPFWADKIIFYADGGLSVGRGNTIRPMDVTRCAYHIVVPGPGRVPRWFVFALYTAKRPEIPVEVIPRRGWRGQDRSPLFREFTVWLRRGNATLDEKTRIRLERLVR